VSLASAWVGHPAAPRETSVEQHLRDDAQLFVAPSRAA